MRHHLFYIAVICAGQFLSSCSGNRNAIYESESYSIFPDRVIQGAFEAIALSPTEISSNYRSPESTKYSPTLQFKFSINSRDNEMSSGKDHMVTLQPVNGKAVTEVEFGKQLIQTQTGSKEENLPENTEWTVRLDLRRMKSDFERQGFYTLFNGEKLSKQDFKGVYIAGSIAPLSWDFSNLYTRKDLEMKDIDGDGIYEITLIMNSRKDIKHNPDKWTLSKNLSGLPQYQSDYLISDAIYNLSLEEMLMAIEPDSTFRTGKEWSGVWTRDISYSIILSMAHMQPEVAKNSLMRKVKNNRIVQDTGTGGAYPVSTDRIVWATAAWELFKVTGDREWMEYAYLVIKNSVEDDLLNAYNPETGLMKGESSFLDWREQTYPVWMQPADIYQSESLGTNAVHYQANKVLSAMANILKKPEEAARYDSIATSIKSGIQQYLWMEEKGYHAQYLYGRSHLILSPRSETLGEALCILFGITEGENIQKAVANMPVTPFGASCIYPQIPGIPPYHNNGIWPFVQSYWALASAKAGNGTSVMEQIAAIYRPAALFLTNKENFVAETGDFTGTQINSSIMLWSLSGNIALIHNIFFGMDFQVDKLVINPFVPKALKGKRTLKNFRYRDAVLHIEMEGFGNRISHFEIDGIASEPEITATLTGEHHIRIVLANNTDTEKKINKAKNLFTVEMPIVKQQDKQLRWESVKNATSYQILRNCLIIDTITTTNYMVNPGIFAAYQVIAMDESGTGSFASEPLFVFSDDKKTSIQIEKFVSANHYPYSGFNGKGFIEISKTKNRRITLPVKVEKEGLYLLYVRYANGNGPVNTDSRCALRNLYVNKHYAGVLIFPQRGKGEWSNWGYSNTLSIRLVKGQNKLTIVYEDNNENMDGEINQAMLDEIVIFQ
ncbi:MAG: hypothetical protein Q7J05_00530 [Paludibacter sp.]|nr:hypothetical protein [Paludibacter sp.]